MDFPLRVSVIVPCRNESAHITDFLDSLLQQELPPQTELEIIISDGASTDRSREILDQYANLHPSIHVVDNPRRIVSTGLNRAIKVATGDVIIRMDVHARYASDYIVQCLGVLEETGADNVGGPARTVATGYMQEAINAAYHSPFACGGARFHDVNYEGYVDTVTFGCWRKTLFEKIGYFDEGLVRNQDDELNFRLVRQGGRIFQSRRIRLWYIPRRSLWKLFSQYFQYGYWKSVVIWKHRSVASLRHLIPGAFVMLVLLLGIISPASAASRHILGAVAGAYLLGAIVAGFLAVGWRRLHLLPSLPIVFLTYHLSYGLGFHAGWLRVLLRKSPEMDSRFAN